MLTRSRGWEADAGAACRLPLNSSLERLAVRFSNGLGLRSSSSLPIYFTVVALVGKTFDNIGTPVRRLVACRLKRNVSWR